MNSVFCKFNLRHFPAVAFAIFAFACLAFFAATPAAQAVTNTGVLYWNSGNNLQNFDNVPDLFNKAKSVGGDVTIKLKDDWDISSSRIEIPEGRNYTINLEGHMINRGKASTSWYGSGSGEVIHVEKNATLTINGGSETTKHLGTLYDASRFWKYDGKGSAVINGGLICGGACDDWHGAGGISSADSSVTITLNNVTVAGNVADTYSWPDRYGNGAGIAIHGSKSTLTLSNSNVIYNHAEGLGGGIYIRNDDCKIYLKDGSEVNNNSSAKDGGGIYIDGNDVNLELEKSSSISNNLSSADGGGIYHNGKRGSVKLSGSSAIKSNVAFGEGGGIYNYYNDTEFKLNASSITENSSAGDGGGALYLNDCATLTLENSSTISSNSAVTGAGVYVDDDGTSITLKGHSSIDKNTATINGGAVYSEVTFSMSLDSSEVSENSARYGSGIYVNNTQYLFAVDCSFDLENNSSISNNTYEYKDSDGYYWRGYGGAFYFYGYGNYRVYSTDKTGVISGCGGTAVVGGGFCIAENSDGVREYTQSKPDTRIEGMTIENCYSTVIGGIAHTGKLTLIDSSVINNAGLLTGGIQALSSSVESPVACGGKVIIQNNKTNSTYVKTRDVALSGNVYLTTAETSKGSGKYTSPSADSRIGVYLYRSSSDTSKVKTKVANTTNFTNEFKDSPRDVIYSNDTNYVVDYDDNKDYLYMTNGYDLTIYDAAGNKKTTKYGEGVTINLKSSDYKKTGSVGGRDTEFVLDYWTISCGEAINKIEPVDGVTSFKMYDAATVVKPHYKSILSGLTIQFNENLTWTELTKDCAAPSADAVSRITLIDADASEKDIDATKSAEYAQVISREIDDETDSFGNVTKKRLTYKVKFSAALLDEIGWAYERNAINITSLKVKTLFGTQSYQGASFVFGTDDAGNETVTLLASFDFDAPNNNLVIISGYNINDPDVQISSEVCAVATSGTVSVKAPDVAGMGFCSWGASTLPDGATLAQDGTLSFPSTGKDMRINVFYKPLVTSVAIEMEPLVLGSAFPSSLKSYKVTDLYERDLTESANQYISIIWSKLDGTFVDDDDVVEGNTMYKATIKTIIPESQNYSFGFSKYTKATVNGEDAGYVAIGSESDQQTVTYSVQTGPDKRFNELLTDLSDQEINIASEYEDYLPKMAHYNLKNGEVHSATLSWTKDIDIDAITSGSFEISGTFTDEYDKKHTVSRKFIIKDDIGVPKASVASGTYSSEQTIEISKPAAWDDISDVEIYYYILPASSDIDPSTIEHSQFTNKYSDPIKISEDSTLLVYAKVGNRETETSQYEYAFKTESTIAVDSGTAYDENNHEVVKAFDGDAVRVEAAAVVGYAFYEWHVVSGNITLDDANDECIAFEMPAQDVELEAIYNEQITASISGLDNLAYDGKAHEASVELSGVKDGDNVSAVLEYRSADGNLLDSAPVNAGAYVATVTALSGKDANKYELAEKTSKTFKISPAKVTSAGAKIKLSKTKFAYNGKVQKPVVKSVILGSKDLTAGKDYALAYSQSKKVGTYKVVVTFKGDYAGKVSANYVINPKAVGKFKAKGNWKYIKLTWKKRAVQVSGFQIKIATSKKKLDKAKTIKVKKAGAKSKIIKKCAKKKLKSGKKYYVQIRAYKIVNGKYYYSSWSKVKKAKLAVK